LAFPLFDGIFGLPFRLTTQQVKDRLTVNRLFPAASLVLLALLAVGVIWLAKSPLAPTHEKVERTIPDDHIPR
jgi:hypothetical protein